MYIYHLAVNLGTHPSLARALRSAALFGALAFLAPAIAQAQGSPEPQPPQFRVAVLASGANDDGTAEGLTAFWENSLVTPLQRNGFHVIPAAVVREAIGHEASCLASDACALALMTRLHTPTVFLLVPEGQSQERVQLSVLRASLGSLERRTTHRFRLDAQLAEALEAFAREAQEFPHPCEVLLRNETRAPVTATLGSHSVDVAPNPEAEIGVFLPVGSHALRLEGADRPPTEAPIACSAGYRWRGTVK